MSWVFDIYSNSNATNTFNSAQNGLDKLTPAQNLSVKVATSDEHDGNGTSLLFYQTVPLASASLPAGPNWQFSTFSDSDYSTAAKDAVDFLNDSLDANQAYYARVSATDHKSGSPVVIVWYLEDEH